MYWYWVGTELYCVLHLEYSPIKGPEGNIEYLLHLRKQEEGQGEVDISAVVEAAHASLDR